MAKLISVEQMRGLELEAVKNGLSIPELMENAGRRLAFETENIAHRYYSSDVPILGLAGPGNNGGDTLIALSILSKSFSNVKGYIVSKKNDQQDLIDALKINGGEVIFNPDDKSLSKLSSIINGSAILIDGLLGTGFKLPLRKNIKKILARAKKEIGEMEIPPIVIAVDCPSGIDNDTGETASDTIPADFTVCMAAVKQGLLKLPAYESIGKLIVVDIGLNSKNSSLSRMMNEVVTDQMTKSFRKKRKSLDAFLDGLEVVFVQALKAIQCSVLGRLISPRACACFVLPRRSRRNDSWNYFWHSQYAFS